MEILFVFLFAILFDLILGEIPSSIHPVVLMGKFIEKVRKPLINWKSRSSGIILTISSILIFTSIFYIILVLLEPYPYIFLLASILIFSTTFSIKILLKTANDVNNSLKDNIKQVRSLVSFLVSRNTKNLNIEELISATIESLTENINDSVTAPILCFSFIGSLLILLNFPNEAIIYAVLSSVIYRNINTLDAMVGYKKPPYDLIGWFPAKLDDILNYIPARLTGILIVIIAYFSPKLNGQEAYNILKRDATATPSPNSGYPMAAAAGALRVKLIKPGVYSLGDSIEPLSSKKLELGIFLTKATIFLIILIGMLIILAVFLIQY